MKTGKQIQGDVFDLINASSLSGQVTGGVYRRGYRPKDSQREDVIVTFTAGLPDQIQTGVVTVNIYVPDIDNGRSGETVENGRRCEELEKAAAEWVKSLTAGRSDYRFGLQQTIYTEAEPELRQHFIVVKLKYELLTT